MEIANPGVERAIKTDKAIATTWINEYNMVISF
jgi:hypothetical protein